MKIKPLQNRVLIKLDRTPQTVAGGLQIVRVPDKDGDYPFSPKRGTVISVGPDVKDLRVGDYVFCHKYEGIELPYLELGERDLMLIREDYVYLVVEGDEKPQDILFGKSKDYWPGPRPKGFEIDERRGIKRVQ